MAEDRIKEISRSPIPVLRLNNGIALSNKEKPVTLVKHYQQISSHKNMHADTLEFQSEFETQNEYINENDINDESYLHMAFILRGLKQVISTKKNTATGSDSISI